MSLDTSRRTFIKQTIAASAAVVLPTSLLSQTSIAYTNHSSSGQHTVLIEGSHFVTKSLPVKVGDTVTWVNKDIVPHTATAKDRSWDTGLIKSGGRASITISAGMTTEYFCEYHPVMVASIKISQ